MGGTLPGWWRLGEVGSSDPPQPCSLQESSFRGAQPPRGSPRHKGFPVTWRPRLSGVCFQVLSRFLTPPLGFLPLRPQRVLSVLARPRGKDLASPALASGLPVLPPQAGVPRGEDSVSQGAGLSQPAGTWALHALCGTQPSQPLAAQTPPVLADSRKSTEGGRCPGGQQEPWPSGPGEVAASAVSPGAPSFSSGRDPAWLLLPDSTFGLLSDPEWQAGP